MTVTRFLKHRHGMSVRHSLVSLRHPVDLLPSPFLFRSLHICPSQPSCWLLLFLPSCCFCLRFLLLPGFHPVVPGRAGPGGMGGAGGGDYSRGGLGSVLGITWDSLGRAAWRAGQGQRALCSAQRLQTGRLHLIPRWQQDSEAGAALGSPSGLFS